MSVGANLPVIVPGMIMLIVVSVGAALALAWTKDASVQQLIRRIWMATSTIVIISVVVFWISSAMVGTQDAAVDRGAQAQQQSDLQQRMKTSGD